MDLFQVDSDMAETAQSLDDEELISFTEMHGDPCNDTHTELLVYLLFLLFKRTESDEYIQRALLWAEGWVEATSLEHSDRKRRLEILDFLMAEQTNDRDVGNNPTESNGPISAETGFHRFAILMSDEYDNKDPDSFPDWIPDLDWLNGSIQMIRTSEEMNTASVGLDMLVFFLRCLYLRTKETSDLSELTKKMELLLKDFPSDGRMIPRELALRRIGDWSNRLFNLTKDIDDLDRAIWAYQELASTTDDDHPDHKTRSAMVGMALHKRFNITKTREDLDNVLKSAQVALDFTPKESSQHIIGCVLVATLLKDRAAMGGLKEDLDHAINLLKSKVGKASSQSFHPLASELLSQCTQDRFDLTGDLYDLDLGISTIEDYFHNSSNISQKHISMSLSFGTFLIQRFQMTGNIHDIHKGINEMEVVMKNCCDDIQKAQALQTLGYLEGLLFQETEDFEHLESCIANFQFAMKLVPLDHPLLVGCRTNLSTWYMHRYEVTGNVDDLDEAIRMISDVSQGGNFDEGDKIFGRYCNIGVLLSKRFECCGEIEDLNKAIEITRNAVEKSRESHPQKAQFLMNLGSWIRVRFENTNAMSDLDEFVEVFETSLKSTLPHHNTAYTIASGNLGTGLHTRHQFTGSIQDLNRAVQLLSDTVDRTPNQTTLRSKWLINLGATLISRYDSVGATSDLARAIACAHEALTLMPSGNASRPRVLRNLAEWELKHLEKAGGAEKLNKALEVAHLALSLTPTENPSYCGTARTVAFILLERFGRMGRNEDINDAVQILQHAIDSSRGDDVSKVGCLIALSRTLTMRFEQGGDVAAINSAIQITEQVLDTMHPDSHDRSGGFQHLAGLLRLKSTQYHSAESRQKILDAELAGWSCANGLPSSRIHLGRNVAAIYASRNDWSEANKVMKEVIRLVPRVNSRALSNHDRQNSLEGVIALQGLASMAAAMSLNAGDSPEEALQLLEQGSGIISGGLTELRTEISNLKSDHPDLAQKFEHIRNQLDLPEQEGKELDDAPGAINRRHTLEELLECVIKEIRGQPGFETFLCPLTEKEMKTAAEVGPLVVVNVGHYRCDAFIVRQSGIGLVPLHDLTVAKTFEMASKIRTDVTSVLEWLWSTITKPVLDYLGFVKRPSGDGWPHIWWIPSALMTWFPIHAAGMYTDRSEETVLDRVISSYSSSVKSLLYSRQHGLKASDSRNALLVSMSQTSGQSSLPSAVKEVQMLREICPELGLQPVEPSYPTRANVLSQLKGCKIFHFAGHGLSDPHEPAESCLVVHDWEHTRLTVRDLRDLRLHEDGPFLSYLSACSTSSNSRETLIDEGIHLVNACQLAGFRHVVGTLWEVSDEHCVDVSRILYSTLKEKGLTDGAVATGLHRALRSLRNRDFGVEDDRTTAELQGEIVEKVSQDLQQSTSGTGVTTEVSSLIDSSGKGDDGRTAIAIPKRKHQPRWHWVPYVHFGV